MKVRALNKKARKTGVNPVRVDPTRTATLRRRFIAELRRRFGGLKAAIIKLVGDEDEFGLDEVSHDPFAANAFCPTGEGGGVDPTCGKGTGAGGVVATLRGFGASAKMIEHAVKDKIAAGIARLPKPVQDGLSAAYKTAFAGWTASQSLAERISIEKGATFEQSRRLRGTLAAADLVAFKPAAAAAAAFDPTGASAVASWVVPPATGAYLAYSTARDPMATVRAAKTLVKRVMAKTRRKLHGRGALVTTNVTRTVADMLVDALTRHGYDDWYIALLCVAMDEAGVDQAVAVADEAWEGQPLTNKRRWRFHSDPAKVKAFQDWLRAQTKMRVLKGDEDALWRAYIEAGYKQGMGRAFDDTKRSARQKAEAAQRLDFYEGTKDEFLRSSFGRPVSVEKVKLLAGRSFDDLKNVTEDMSARLSRRLVDGLIQGKGARELSRDLVADVGVSQQRAELIARTEIIRAHAEGQLSALEEMGVEEVGVMVEWSTAGDAHVCPLCRPLEGIVLKIAEARGMIPRHPNCRCAFLPANVGESATGQKRSKGSIDKAVATSAKRGGDPDWGPDVAKTRPTSILNSTALLPARPTAVDPALVAFSEALQSKESNGWKEL